MFDALTDQLLPTRLAVKDIAAFQPYRAAYTQNQLRFALWLGFGAFAAYGLTDFFEGHGGIEATRFRFIVACPILALFGITERTAWARSQRDAFISAYSLALGCILFGQLYIVDNEELFRIGTGTPTVNFFVVLLFGYGLFPVMVLDGLVFGLCMLVSHTSLILTARDLQPPMLPYSYIYNVVIGVSAGMFIAYWREWFIRSEFHNTMALSGEKERLKDALVGYVTHAGLERKYGEAVAHAFGEVSVLFCDIAGFTTMSERLAQAPCRSSEPDFFGLRRDHRET